MAIISPGASSDRAMWPGPWPSSMTSGSPARTRFHPPAMGMGCICTVGSVHSTWWCEK